MKFKKRINGSWTDIPYYINTIMTDSLTILPTTLYTDNSEIVVGVKGNAIQSGVPTPDSPVMPQGTGERTGNLAYGRIDAANVFSNGTIVRAGGYDVAIGRVESGIVYTVNSYVLAFYTDEPTTGSVSYDGSRIVATVGRPTTFTAPITGYVAFRLNSGEQAMLNLGSTALPFEPYGYKIPILSNSQTTNVYLGEAESTRRIKKWVFTGTEEWNKGNYAPSGGYQFFTPKPSNIADNSDWLITHFKKGSGLNGSAFASYLSLYPEKSILPENATANDFKTWLATQYAAGTPVTVWYVLANEETAVVNEPLMKIGDYADEIINISVPTIVGTNTFNIDTVVQPSEVTLNYHGWHPITNVHERNNGAWN